MIHLPDDYLMLVKINNLLHTTYNIEYALTDGNEILSWEIFSTILFSGNKEGIIEVCKHCAKVTESPFVRVIKKTNDEDPKEVYRYPEQKQLPEPFIDV